MIKIIISYVSNDHFNHAVACDHFYKFKQTNMKIMKSLLLMSVLLSCIMIPTSCDENEEQAHNGAYSLRDIGPAGGWIFYINPNYKTDGWRYIEAAPSDQSPKVWGSFETAVTGADGTIIGA